MYINSIITTLAFQPYIPMIDSEFDRFEMNHDLETDLREAETATFYHDALNVEE